MFSALANICKLIETFRRARQAAWAAGHLHMQSHLRKSGMTFIKAVRFTFPYIPHTDNLAGPFYIKSHLGYIGGTSFETKADMVDQQSGQTVIRSTLYWVYVDKKTRKKADIPKWFKDKFETGTSKTESVLPLLAPTDLPSVKRCVTDSDIDKFGHLNNEIYIEECVASIKSVIEKNKLHEYNSQTLTQPIMEVQVLYTGESRLGEEIEIFSWTNKQKPGYLFAQVQKDAKPIVHGTFKLHNNMSQSRL